MTLSRAEKMQLLAWTVIEACARTTTHVMFAQTAIRPHSRPGISSGDDVLLQERKLLLLMWTGLARVFLSLLQFGLDVEDSLSGYDSVDRTAGQKGFVYGCKVVGGPGGLK
jgi:hypothetical protein